MGFSRQEYWSGLPFPSPGDLPDSGTEPGSPTLEADALISEPPGKPKNTGVGCHSLFQEIFPTQELNWGLLHCRQILYQLSYQEVKSLSCVWLFATPWTVAYWAPLSMGFSRQEYWSGLHFLLQRIFPTQGSNPGLPQCRQALYGLSHKSANIKPAFLVLQIRSSILFF